jgi:hypothetical protein
MLQGLQVRKRALSLSQANPPLRGTLPATKAMLRSRKLSGQPDLPQRSLPLSGPDAALRQELPPIRHVLPGLPRRRDLC